MSIGSASLIGRTSRIIRRHGMVLFGLSLWPFALSLTGLVLLMILPASRPQFRDPIQLWKSLSWLMRLSWILGCMVQIYLAPMLALAGISEIVSADQRGTQLSLRDALLRVLRALRRLIVLAISVGFLANIGLQALVLPGLAVLAITTFAVPAIMLEGKGVRAAWRRSDTLALQPRSGVFSLFGGLLVTGIVIYFVFVAFRPTDVEAAKIYFLAWMLLFPPLVAVVFGTMNTLLFLDSREQENAQARGVQRTEEVK